jgi:hypothetical protein
MPISAIQRLSMDTTTKSPFEAYKGTDPYIFVSYSHKDSDKVFPIISEFHKVGFPIWYDEGIDPGNEWPKEIATALLNCSLFIVFISASAAASKNVVREINFALKKDKHFIPIWLEETTLDPGLDMQITSNQGINRFNMEPENFYRQCQKSFEAFKIKKTKAQAGSEAGTVGTQASPPPVVIMPSSVKSIGEGVSSDSNLTNVTIPNGVTSIEAGAFKDNSSLTSVTIPDSVISIGNYAFSECKSLTSVTIPGSVKSIGEEAFVGCIGLTSITIPSSVTSIGKRAFAYCAFLINVTIPSSVTSIEELVFFGCFRLTSVTIPSSVKSIGAKAFGTCTSLTSVTIPDSVKSIGEKAFEGCKRLTSVTIPSSVKSIGAKAFEGCTSLTSVTMSRSVRSIGEKAFEGCPWQPKGCFITTAVCGSFGKSDDCRELTAFRDFRDNWLAKQPDGQALINEYYRIAPAIVAAIERRTNRDAVYRGIWDTYLADCMRLIENHEFAACKQRYIEMVEELVSRQH